MPTANLYFIPDPVGTSSNNTTPVIIVDDGRNFNIESKKKRKSGKSKLGKILNFGKKKKDKDDTKINLESNEFVDKYIAVKDYEVYVGNGDKYCQFKVFRRPRRKK